jgi:hypothetical protein
VRRRALHIRHVAQEEKCHEVTLGRLLFKFRHELIVYRTLRDRRIQAVKDHIRSTVFAGRGGLDG